MVARQPLALPLCQLPWSWCRWPWAASRKNGSQQRTRAGHSRRSRTSFEGFLVFWVMEALYQIRFHKFKQAVKQMPFSSFFIGFVWDVFLERFCSQPILAWFLTLVNCAAHHLPYFTWKQLHLKAAGKSESLNMGMICCFSVKNSERSHQFPCIFHREELTSIRHNHFEKRELCFLCLVPWLWHVDISYSTDSMKPRSINLMARNSYILVASSGLHNLLSFCSSTYSYSHWLYDASTLWSLFEHLFDFLNLLFFLIRNDSITCWCCELLWLMLYDFSRQMMFAGAVVIMFVGLLQNDPRTSAREDQVHQGLESSDFSCLRSLIFMTELKTCFQSEITRNSNWFWQLKNWWERVAFLSQPSTSCTVPLKKTNYNFWWKCSSRPIEQQAF